VVDIQIASVRQPLDDPQLLAAGLEALALAQAMGLLPRGEVVDRLDLPTIRRVSRAAGRAGIATSSMARLAVGDAGRDEVLRALGTLVDALEESPLPEREWASLSELLGPELLAALVGISPSSLRRYAGGSRRTPDPVAARLHFLATVVADLLGTYNEPGVRRWFDRPRAPLGDRSPREVLQGEWSPEDEGPRAVRALARSLLAGAAT
jgi:uncharacterized protein (DUF2384 family)